MRQGPDASRWKPSLAVLPAVGVGLLPKIICPACWPAYTGLLSSLGIGFLPTSPYLLPLTLASLALAVGVLAWQTRRHGIAPLLLGVVGAVVIVAGRFGLASDAVVYVGIGLLCGASLWAARPRRAGACPACTHIEPATIHEEIEV
jgi:hypothetical protein